MVVELSEVDRSSLEKTRSKNVKKRADPGLRLGGGDENRPFCGGGRDGQAAVLE